MLRSEVQGVVQALEALADGGADREHVQQLPGTARGGMRQRVLSRPGGDDP